MMQSLIPGLLNAQADCGWKPPIVLKRGQEKWRVKCLQHHNSSECSLQQLAWCVTWPAASPSRSSHSAACHERVSDFFFQSSAMIVLICKKEPLFSPPQGICLCLQDQNTLFLCLRTPVSSEQKQSHHAWWQINSPEDYACLLFRSRR